MSGRDRGRDDEAESRRAFHELLGTLAEIDRVHLAPERGVREPAEVATGIRFLLHLLGGGLDLALEADPRRPEFRPTMSAGRRWDGWAAEVAAIPGDRGLMIYPFLWAEGPASGERTRGPVPIEELWRMWQDLAARGV